MLALREGKTRLVHEKFDQAYQFFDKEGYEGDRFRAEFYLKLSGLNLVNQDEQAAKFSAWLDLPRSEEKKSSLFRMASEFQHLLQQTLKANPASGGISGILSRLQAYDYSLIDIQKTDSPSFKRYSFHDTTHCHSGIRAQPGKNRGSTHSCRGMENPKCSRSLLLHPSKPGRGDQRRNWRSFLVRFRSGGYPGAI